MDLTFFRGQLLRVPAYRSPAYELDERMVDQLPAIQALSEAVVSHLVLAEVDGIAEDQDQEMYELSLFHEVVEE